jgi:diacylglycerol kinase family enzyme
MKTRHPLDAVKRLVVLHNPASTNANYAEELIKDLRHAMPDKQISVVRTTPDGEEPNRRRLIGALAKGGSDKQLLIVAGGDGAIHYAVKALLHPDTPSRLRHTPLTPWPTGNANDFFHSIHNREKRETAIRVLQHADARLVTVHPLEWRIQDETGKWEELAVSYGTIGSSAKSTYRLNRPEHRSRRKSLRKTGRFLLDSLKTVSTLWQPPRVTIQLNGRRRRVTEMQFINGPIMAIVAHYNIKHSDRAMFFGITSGESRIKLALTTLRMGMGAPPGKRTSKPVQFTIDNDKPVPAQVDGEYFELRNGTVRVGPSREHVVIWATKDA